MEDPASLLSSSAATHSLASSPEHSRARHVRPRAAERLSSGRRLGRRREGPGEETRRGRSWTRSLSPSEIKSAAGAAKREPRKGLRRRSRSPSRSSVVEEGDGGESPILKRQKTGEVAQEGVRRNDESVSSRSRSKRRRKYRRRSDYAAAAAARGDVRRLMMEEDDDDVMEEEEGTLEEEDEDEDGEIAVDGEEADEPAHVSGPTKKTGLRDKIAAKMGRTGHKKK